MKAAILLMLSLAAPAFAQSNTAAGGADLSGFWERRDTTGAGSFGAMLAGLPRAVLVNGFTPPNTPGPQLPGLVVGQPNAVGVPYIVTTGRCTTSASLSIPFMMTHSSPIDIVQTKDEILIVPEYPTAQRIFMDGRPHPPAGNTPSGLGHSIGHWEGATLVVHTTGMTAGAVLGGGYKTPETELTQRFRLIEGGKQLAVEFTWVDPKIYRKPHTFELTYFRMSENTYALEEWCDSSDPLQQQSIVPPTQD